MQENYEEIVTTRKKVTVEELVDEAEKEGAEVENKVNYTFIEDGPLDYAEYDSDLNDKEKYGANMYQFLTRSCKHDDSYYSIKLSEYFEQMDDVLKGMGCDKNENHSTKDRFKNSVKKVIKSMNTKAYSNVNLLGHTKLSFNYDDLGFVGALVVSYLDLKFDEEFTPEYAKEALESLAKSEVLCTESINTFYEGLYIKREDRNKTVASQEKFFNSHSKGLSAQELFDLKYKLACELGPITPENHGKALTAVGAYVRLKEYHNNKSFMDMVFHPFNYHSEYKLLKEMKNVLVKKLGLSKEQVESLNTGNTTVLSDNVAVVDYLFKNNPRTFDACIFRDKEKSARDNIMVGIKKDIEKVYADEIEYDNIHGIKHEALDNNGNLDEELNKSNIAVNDLTRKKVTAYIDNDNKPVSVADEFDYFVGENTHVIEKLPEIESLKWELKNDGDQCEWKLENLTENQAKNIFDNVMENNL